MNHNAVDAFHNAIGCTCTMSCGIMRGIISTDCDDASGVDEGTAVVSAGRETVYLEMNTMELTG